MINLLLSMDFLLRIFFIIGNELILKNYLVKKLSSLLLRVLNRNFHHYLSCLKSSLQHHSNAEISPSFLIPVSSIGWTEICSMPKLLWLNCLNYLCLLFFSVSLDCFLSVMIGVSNLWCLILQLLLCQLMITLMLELCLIVYWEKQLKNTSNFRRANKLSPLIDHQ